MPTLALIGHLIDGVAGGPTGPVSGGAAARAVAWCAYLQGHARRLYTSVTDRAQVAAALLAAQLTHGRLPSPFTARDVYRNEWTGLTEPRVVQGALAYHPPGLQVVIFGVSMVMLVLLTYLMNATRTGKALRAVAAHDPLRPRAGPVTILLVEQSASLALQIADRAYVLEAGRLTISGPAAALLSDERVQRAYLG